MVRKHTRRAAKAAFAVSFGVALLIGLVAAGYGSRASTAKAAAVGNPKIILGSKNFPEETLLGQLYGQALKVKGFPVTYKASIGSSELIDTAITSGKINIYPEYTGIIALDLAKVKNAPKTAKATYQVAKTFEQGRGLTLTKPTPFADTDTFTMLRSTAKKDGLTTLSDLKKLSSFSYAGYPECTTRITCILGMKKIYGLKHIKYVQIGTISVYTLLDEHKVDGGDGFSTDPQELQKKYVALVDNKHIFGFQNVAPVVKKSLLSGPGGPLLKETLNAVSAKLTLKAMRQMNKAIVIDKVSIATVAKKFLQANGLA